MQKIGILRGPNLNPYEGQYFEKLTKYGFQPIGITTLDKKNQLPEITFPIRAGHNLKTLTKGTLRPIFSVVGRATKYNFGSWNLRIIGLKKLVKDLELIHSADHWYPFTYQAVKTGKPTVTTEWENIPFNVKGKPYIKIQEYNREHINHFIAITEKAKEALIVEGIRPERISVIPAGIDCDKFRPSSEKEPNGFGTTEDALKILFVGRLTPEKGIFDLFNSFALITKKQSNIELLIVGTGTPQVKKELTILAQKLQITDKVKFLGSIPYSEMVKIHNLADVFCLPSVRTSFWAEQFGYSIVEAMACEKPIVSTISGSIPEIVKHKNTGILVEEKNPMALQAALEELLYDKKEREQYGRNARAWVLKSFEANKVAKQLAALYEKII